MIILERITNDDTIDYKILIDIYLLLGQNLLSDSNHKFNYDTRYIFRSHIPDFITNNENKFVNENSEEYLQFIKLKIEEYVKNQDKFFSKPSFHIIFKLHQLFPKSYSTLIMYNQMYNSIETLSIDSIFMRFKNIIIDNKMKILKSDTVLDSCLFHAYNIIGIPEYLNYYIEKVFICREYKLLSSELDFLDSYDISDLKYNNLKWLIFKCALEEAISNSKYGPLELDKIIDVTQIPPINSSKFSIFMSWYLLQKLNNKSVPIIDIPNENINLNINKVYKYFINLDTQTIKKIIKWVITNGIKCDPKLDLLNRYSIDTIFNSEGQIYKTETDYIDNTNYKIKIEDDEYRLILKSRIISSDNYFDNFNFEDYKTESDEETELNDNKTKNNKSSKTAHIGGFNKVDGFYKFKLKNNEIINIISPLPFCKMFYFIRYFE